MPIIKSSGEHLIQARCGRTLSGSSPLERGTLLRTVVQIVSLRFIPARAGNTTLRFTFSGKTTVHPRTSGEHMVHRRAVPVEVGSSPHERGTRYCGR